MAKSPTSTSRGTRASAGTTKPAAATKRAAKAAKPTKPTKPTKPNKAVDVEPKGGANADPLARYRGMRDFGTTSEPSGDASARKAAPRTKKAAPALSFVVQKHAARRLHYDFRLELDGTLKSWAIPKGPSLDPADKRMGVHVEDHPLEYGSFEGVIPEKQYGAGTVIVWDRGTWVPTEDPQAGYRNGKLKFELQGEKLHGGWTLVKMKNRADARQEPWLLIKERDDWARPAAEFDITQALPDSVLSGVMPAADSPRASKTPSTGTAAKRAGAKASRVTAAVEALEEEEPADDTPSTRTRGGRGGPDAAPALPEGARPAALPLTLSPQLATLVTEAPAQPDQWVYEVKFDGYRILARVDGAKVTLFTRNGHDWTSKLKTLAQQVAALGLPSGWLDGEIVVVGEDGNTDFQALQNAFDSARTDTIQYFVFDLPYYAGHDLRKVPLLQRRALLRRLFQSEHPPRRVRFSESFEVGAGEILTAACRLRLEGVIGKRVDAPYVSKRADSWIKLKCSERQEFVIGGFTEPQGSRTGIGALLLGIHDEQGRLVYAGKVGTGFDTDTLDDIRKKLDAVRADAAPFHQVPKGVKGLWVRPKLVAEVSFGAWTKDGLIRHSVFHGLRTDKSAGAIGREKAVPPPDADTAASGTRGRKSAAASGAADKPGRATKAATAAPRAGGKAGAGGDGTVGGIKVSHADRVIDPSTGLTKGDLVRYYEAVGPVMLPHLVGRPVALVRGPSGVGGELFFQKHGDTLRMPGIRQLDPSLWPEHPPMLEIATETGLVAAAQFNVIEFHTWNADKRSIEKPDRIVFDLDPGEGVPWQHVTEAAALTRAMLDELGLVAFLKTSGGKGLHVVVPLQRKLEWDEVKAFSQDVVVHMARTIPQRFVAKSGPRNRVGKIFIDYLRNGRGATTAAAFSARARPGLGVSIPIHWEELKTLRSGAQWTIADAIARVEEMSRDDPWADYASTRQTLTAAIKRIRSG